jgi:hypothetical protein
MAQMPFKQHKKTRTLLKFNLRRKKMNNRDDLLQGPRLKSDATYDLERIAKALLYQPESVNFSYNNKHELEVFIDGITYNITHILKNKPDFEQFIFSRSELIRYAKLHQEQYGHVSYISHLLYRLKYEYDVYQKGEIICVDDIRHLSRGEQLAISSYTNHSEYIQNFLFSEGTNDFHLYNNNYTQFKQVLTHILLTTCIASYGLSQPLLQKREGSIICQRLEKVDPSYDFFKKKKEAAEKQKIYRHIGFTSANQYWAVMTADFLDCNCQIQITSSAGLNPIGKSIKFASVAKFEDEILFPPGTQFQYTEYTYKKPERPNSIEHHFSCVPVRLLNDINPYSYQSPFPKKNLYYHPTLTTNILPMTIMTASFLFNTRKNRAAMLGVGAVGLGLGLVTQGFFSKKVKSRTLQVLPESNHPLKRNSLGRP